MRNPFVFANYRQSVPASRHSIFRSTFERFPSVCAALFAVTGILGGVSAQAAAPKDANPLVESSLTAALRVNSEQSGSAVAKARLDLQTAASQFPREQSKAKVVLSRGFTTAELDSLASKSSLEVLQVEVKIPVPGSDEIYTVMLTGAALEQVDGKIGVRVQNALKTTRANFLKWAAADPASGPKFKSLANDPMLIYSFESIGKNDSLEMLAGSNQVRLVQRVSTADVSAELNGLRSLRESMHADRVSVSPAGKPPITNLCAAQAATNGVTSAGGGAATNACPNDPIEPPDTALPVPSGVPFVDSGLAGSTQFLDPYRDTEGTANGKIDYVLDNDFLLGCDSSVTNYHCPNDLTYTATGRFTNGLNAWGAGVRWTGGSVNTVECELVYNPGNDTSNTWGWVCYRVTVTSPKWTYATATMQFAFGTKKVWVPVTIDNPNTVPYYVSTYAWKGPPQGPSGEPAQCDANGFSLTAPDRPCPVFDRNGNLVTGQSGFEAKIVIPNPSCGLTIRTGTSADKNLGCFSSDSFVTNLPTPYLDTTFEDQPDNTGQNRFVESIGVVDGKQLVEGRPYNTQIMGSMKGWEDVRGNGNPNYYVRHLQAVTVRDSQGTVCLTGVGSSGPGSDAACMFNVDLSKVGPDKFFR